MEIPFSGISLPTNNILVLLDKFEYLIESLDKTLVPIGPNKETEDDLSLNKEEKKTILDILRKKI